MLEHGGRLRRAAAQYGMGSAAWLDLSTGISPWSWIDERDIQIPRDAWRRLPEPDDDLDAAAQAFYGAAALPVAGTQVVIQTLPRLRAACRVGVTTPSYAEHAHCWRNAGHDVITLSADSIDAQIETLDVLVLVQPNNPDGRRVPREQLLEWQARLAVRKGWLLIDEAFIDAEPKSSLATETHRPGLIVLRSLGKFFGLAGARAGFVLAHEMLRNALSEALGPWTLSGPTRHIASLALRDGDWHARQRIRLPDASRRLSSLLTGLQLAPQGGCALFQWVRTPHAASLHEALARQGILTRRFEDPSSLRFGLPHGEAEWQRLRMALAQTRTLGA